MLSKNLIELLDEPIKEQHLKFQKLVDLFEEHADVKYIPNTKLYLDKLNELVELKEDEEFFLWLSEKCATTVPNYNILYMFVAHNCMDLFDNTQMVLLNYSSRVTLLKSLYSESVEKEIEDLEALFASMQNNVFELDNINGVLNLTVSNIIDMAGVQNFVE